MQRPNINFWAPVAVLVVLALLLLPVSISPAYARGCDAPVLSPVPDGAGDVAGEGGEGTGPGGGEPPGSAGDVGDPRAEDGDPDDFGLTLPIPGKYLVLSIYLMNGR